MSEGGLPQIASTNQRSEASRFVSVHHSAGRLRVLYVIPGKPQSFGMSFSRRQASDVAALGVEVYSFFLRSRTSPLFVSREMVRLRKAIKAFAPHVVHAQFGTMTAFLAALASNQPLVITFHGSDLNPAPGDRWLRSKLGHLFSHLAARRARQIICVSPQLRTHLPDIQPWLHVVPCGVDLKQFCPRSQAEARQKLGWAAKDKVVLFNARTDPVGKRLDLAEAACNLARRAVPDLRLHVFQGRTPPDDMPHYYAAADALLMTSDYEGSPMVVKEAMACNLPVVSVDVGDVCERLTGVTHSYIVKRDPSHLGDALVKVLHPRSRSNGREFAQSFSSIRVAEQVVTIYRSAASTEHVPSHPSRGLLSVDGLLNLFRRAA